jgi:hypothetical protein
MIVRALSVEPSKGDSGRSSGSLNAKIRRLQYRRSFDVFDFDRCHDTGFYAYVQN